MSALTIRNIPEETHRALKLRASQNGRSTEAEVRAILEAAVRPPERLLLGSALNAIGRRHNITRAEMEAIESLRSKTPAEPMKFE